jgi:NADH-quinone oxidoreductase subunit J
MGISLYFIFGALAGLTFLRAAKSRAWGGRLLWAGAGCLFLLVAAIAAVRGVGGFSDLVFYVVGLISVIAALRVVSQTNPVHSAVWLITVFLCMAVLFLLRRAEFLAVVQLIIYAGAIMVLYVFIIMFVDIEVAAEGAAPAWTVAAALGTTALLLLVLAPIALQLRPEAPAAQVAAEGAVERMGEAIYFGATLPFEAMSLVLLVALVGAMLIGKAERE